MGWVEENFAAVLSGVLVPLLVVVVKPLMERDSGGRELRRIRRHAQLRSLMPSESEAAAKLDAILSQELDRFVLRETQRLMRKIDGITIFMMIAFSGVGGAISFGLVTWAQASVGIWAWTLWAVCVVWTLFVLVFVLVGGLTNLYQKVEEHVFDGSAPEHHYRSVLVSFHARGETGARLG